MSRHRWAIVATVLYVVLAIITLWCVVPVLLSDHYAIKQLHVGIASSFLAALFLNVARRLRREPEASESQ